MKRGMIIRMIGLLAVIVCGGWLMAQDSVSAGGDTEAAPSASAPATPAAGATTEAAPEEDLAAFKANALLGRDLFLGQKSFLNKGPSCISCHNVAAADVMSGGLLAKDLTHVHERLGDAGIPAILGTPPYPAMAVAYQYKPLSKEEITQLTAFFKEVSQNAAPADPSPNHKLLLLGGGVGTVIWFFLIFAIYSNRKKNTVKKDIYDRQIQY